MERNYCLCMLLKSLPSAKSWNLEVGRKEGKKNQHYWFSTNNNTSNIVSLYLLRFCQKRNNIFCTGSYKELLPEEICLRNPQT